MDTHRSDSFTSLAGLLAFKQMKKAKKNGTPIPLPTSNLADMTPGARSPRTFINNLYGGFIDEYLSTYKSLSGQAGARDKLVAEIMEAAKTRTALGFEGVPGPRR